MTALERFEAKWIPEPNSGCWLWEGAAAYYGRSRSAAALRGSFHLGLPGHRQKMLAHQASWIIYRGTIPPGLCVCHSCDTPLCVNPAHLFVGTQMDNVTDHIMKGRGSLGRPIGAANTKTKLDADKVRQVRTSHDSARSLARRFGVNRTTIGDIRNGKNWRHVA